MMFYKSESYGYLFHNLKNGDFLGFYKKPWYYLFVRFISLITGNKLSHIAGVFDVVRKERAVSFKLGEQSASQGKVIRKYHVVKVDTSNYSIDSRFEQKHTVSYLLSNTHRLTYDQNKTVGEYWDRKEDYSFSELPFTINWFYKLFGNKNKVYDNNCSTAARQSMIEIGIKDTKFDDKVPNPTEFAKFNYIEEIIKIDNEES